jgi:hypothetical protein
MMRPPLIRNRFEKYRPEQIVSARISAEGGKKARHVLVGDRIRLCMHGISLVTFGEADLPRELPLPP